MLRSRITALQVALALALWLSASLSGPALAQGLPPAVEADRQMQVAGAEMKKADKGEKVDWARVLSALRAAQATGAPLPTNFDYHLGRALHHQAQHAAAMQQLERYLRAQGAQARYYSESLALYTQSQAAHQQQVQAQQEKERIDKAWQNVETVWWSRLPSHQDMNCCTLAQERVRWLSKSARQLRCMALEREEDFPPETDRIALGEDFDFIACKVVWQGNPLLDKSSFPPMKFSFDAGQTGMNSKRR